MTDILKLAAEAKAALVHIEEVLADASSIDLRVAAEVLFQVSVVTHRTRYLTKQVADRLEELGEGDLPPIDPERLREDETYSNSAVLVASAQNLASKGWQKVGSATEPLAASSYRLQKLDGVGLDDDTR